MTVSQIFRIFQGVYILGLFSRSAVSTSLHFEVSKASVFSSVFLSIDSVTLFWSIVL